MEISTQGIKLIQVFESCRLVAYKCAAGIWTIGWGSTRLNGVPVKSGDKITAAEADEQFSEDLKTFSAGVLKLLGEKAVKQQQFDALVSWSYNLGLRALKGSTLLKKVLTNPNDTTIQDEFIKWRNKGSSFEKGLLRRRLAEANMYFHGTVIYKENDWATEINQIMKK